MTKLISILDNDNHDYLKRISDKAKKSAEETLKIAKEQEKEKLQKGYTYQPVNDKTFILKRN